MKKDKFFFRQILWFFMIVVVCGVIATIILTNVTLRSIEKNLPSTLLIELNDLSLILENLAEVVNAAERAKAQPSAKNFSLLKAKTEIVYNDIVQLRESYVFDNLVQASAFHAVVAPAIADLRIWLTDGVSGSKPDTETTAAIVFLRINEAFKKSRSLNRDSRIRSQEILEEQRKRLEHFLFSVNLLFTLTILITFSMIVLLIRQYMLQNRESVAQGQLREQRDLLNSLFENVMLGITVWSKEGKLLLSNRRLNEITGYSLEEIKTLDDWFIKAYPDPAYRKKVLTAWEESSVQKKAVHEFRITCKDGAVKNIEWGATFLSDGRTLVSISDITERKRMEENLWQMNQFLDSIIENIPNMIFLKDAQDLRFIRFNRAGEDLLGYSRDELLGKTDYDFFPKEQADFFTEKDRDTLLHGRIVDIPEETIQTRHRGERVLHTQKISVLDRNGRAEYLLGISEDITERKQAYEALLGAQRRLMDIIEFLPDATLVIDKEGKIIAWNRAIENLTGIKKEDMLGKGNYEYALPFYGERRPILIDLALHPDREMEKQYTAVQRIGDILFGESYTLNLPHDNIHLSATASVLRDFKGEIIAAIECIRDNTGRKRMEERLGRAEKMEALGTLAGGVAHDLNNVLGVLVGYSELLAEKLPDQSPLRKHTQNILQSSIRGAAIIQDLLALARRGVSVSEVVDFNRVVSDYLRTPEFENLKFNHPQVNIITALEEGLLNIKGSPVHLGKAVMNLVSNAAEAISGRGEVTIKTGNRYLDHPLQKYDGMQEGDYVILTVTDTGSGISADDLGKIFEPFYTKKVMGRSGTGLGLAVVWGTVKDHNGYIDVQSKEGKGSVFTLYFPVTREVPTKVEKAEPLVSYMGKGEFILVVDDVKEQREVASSMLERLGYRVEAVAGGEEAIAYLKDKKADLVVLDMIMDPRMDGMETYRKILEISPKQKAVIASGFSESDRVRKTQEMGAGAFVRKPYILERIGLAVRKELDRE